MIAILQRVLSATVEVGGVSVGSIGAGLCVLLGVARGDGEAQAVALARRCADARVFPDGRGRLGLGVLEAGGTALVVPNFTLCADVRKPRLSFDPAAPPAEAEALYERFCAALRELGVPVQTGRFGAHMAVNLCCDGPVTVTLENL